MVTGEAACKRHYPRGLTITIAQLWGKANLRQDNFLAETRILNARSFICRHAHRGYLFPRTTISHGIRSGAS